MFISSSLCRGVSSTVRRCIEKETGKEYAAKIIDLSNESAPSDGGTSYEAIKQEISILRLVAGHPYISKYTPNLIWYVKNYFIHRKTL